MLLSSPGRVRDRIWETERQKKQGKRQTEKHVWWKVSQRMTRRAVSQELNIFAYLSCDWRIKRHSSTPSSPTYPTPNINTRTSPVNLTVAFHFIILHILFLHQCLSYCIYFAVKYCRCSRLIIFCLPCPLNATTTAAALLGVKDGRSERFDLAWASCKVHHSPKDKTTYQ